jgi:hypothetical protein
MSLRYLAYGLIVLATYWFTAHRGYVFFQGDTHDVQASPARVHGPTFWGTGYQGGK